MRNSDLARRLKDARAIMGHSVETAAAQMSVSAGSVYLWERGNRVMMPKTQSMLAIEEYLATAEAAAPPADRPLPKQLRRARATLGHTQRFAAGCMGVAMQTVRGWELGTGGAPSKRSIRAIEKYLASAATMEEPARQASVNGKVMWNSNWSEQLKQARATFGHSRRQAAYIIGVGATTVKDWERSNGMPRRRSALAVKKYLMAADAVAVPAKLPTEESRTQATDDAPVCVIAEETTVRPRIVYDCPACWAEVKRGMRFCPACGKELPWPAEVGGGIQA